MKAHKVELFIIDFDDVGAEEIQNILENNHYPNHCIAPTIKKVQTIDIGDWHDDHPLNKRDSYDQEYQKLFEPKSD